MSNKTDNTDVYVGAWLLVTALILIPALLLGGGPGWLIGAPILAAWGMLIGHSGNNTDDDDDDDHRGPRRKSSSIGKKVLIGGGALAAGYAVGKKLEL